MMNEIDDDTDESESYNTIVKKIVDLRDDLECRGISVCLYKYDNIQDARMCLRLLQMKHEKIRRMQMAREIIIAYVHILNYTCNPLHEKQTTSKDVPKININTPEKKDES